MEFSGTDDGGFYHCLDSINIIMILYVGVIEIHQMYSIAGKSAFR